MRIVDKESWLKNNGIINGIHEIWKGQETLEEFLRRCPEADVEICDFCGRQFHLMKGHKLIETDIDVGEWKCAEYSCTSYICDSCVKEALELFRNP